jgi:30S ribosomal protein S31
MGEKAGDEVSCFFLFLHSKIYKMGRGDKRTKRGKISSGTFGKSRPAKIKKATAKAEKKA